MTTGKLHPDSDNDPSYELLSESEKAHHKLIWWWFRLLARNETYQAYCEAVRNGDTDTQERLTVETPTLIEVFSDWGDVHSPDLRWLAEPHYKGFQKWLASKRHLFFPASVQWLRSDTASAVGDGIVISIPNVGDKAHKMKLLKDFIERNHDAFPASSLQLQPKYQVRKDLVLRTVLMLGKAEIIDSLKEFGGDGPDVPEESRSYSNDEIEEWLIRLANDKELEVDIEITWDRSADGAHDKANNIRQINRIYAELRHWIDSSAKGLFPAMKQ
ncbi:Uncharacterised protein [Comamonas aquatica]|uniref:hypothetical protein n=1 Tax=Comamonas aquatica TaxID=225991 RepID=UPI001EF33B96|nr:hypothetical protein [Comamonas aquatica]CAB5654334.1 Uncharacterised protein [Comamonas aquatica]CAC9184066.1 Uncharacterised protein [Comamonas aquatica]